MAFAPDAVFIAVDLAVIFFVGNDDVALFVKNADAVGNGINQGLEEWFGFPDFSNAVFNIVQHAVEGVHQVIKFIWEKLVGGQLKAAGIVAGQNQTADFGQLVNRFQNPDTD